MTTGEKRARRHALLGLLVGVVCLLFLFRQVDAGRLWQLVRTVKPGYFAAVMVILVPIFAARAWRWQLLMEPAGGCTFGDALSANLVGYMAISVLPARMGELVRIHAMARLSKISFSGVAATVLVERAVDALNVMLLLGVAAVFLKSLGGAVMLWSSLWGPGLTWLGVVVVLFTALLFSSRIMDVFRARVTPVLTRAFPSRAHVVAGMVDDFGVGLRGLNRAGRILGVLAMTAGISAGFIASSAVFLPSVGLPMSIRWGFVLYIVMSLAVAVPAGPAGLGPSQLAAYGCLVMLGAEADRAVAYSLLFWAVNVMPVTLAGLVEMWRRGIHISRARKGAEA